MDTLNLSWVIGNSFPKKSGGNIDFPSWSMVTEKLNRILVETGSVSLGWTNENHEAKSLQVRAENGQYLVMFGFHFEGDWIVKTCKNKNIAPPGEMIEFCGDMWNSQIVISDSSLIFLVFEELFLTGNVSDKYVS